MLFSGKRKKEYAALLELAAGTTRSLALIVDELAGLRRELFYDYLCGAWTSPDKRLGLSLSKLPDGYSAVLFENGPQSERTLVRRYLLRIAPNGILYFEDGNQVAGVRHENIEDSLTLGNIGVFYRDDIIYGQP